MLLPQPQLAAARQLLSPRLPYAHSGWVPLLRLLEAVPAWGDGATMAAAFLCVEAVCRCARKQRWYGGATANRKLAYYNQQ
jgi:hypothetical protein